MVIKRSIAVFIFSIFILTFLSAQEDIIHSDEETLAPVTQTEDEELESSDIELSSQDETDEAPHIVFAARFGIAAGIVATAVLLIWLMWRYLFRFLINKITKICEHKVKPLHIKKFRILSKKQIINIVLILIRFIKYLMTGLLLYITAISIFYLFPATRPIAQHLFDYVWIPAKDFLLAAINFIFTDLIRIIIIITASRYILKAIKYFARQISGGKLVLPGFYADWAEPTLRILQVLIWAFTIAMVYPFLPGSDSGVFQGISVFIGLIFSLGSSSAIGNMMAGLVITYMRPFKIGDRVKIKDVTGFVSEKNMMVVRIRTHKNEYVTFPNTIILNSDITNYTSSSNDESDGLIIYADITYGYSTPWETIHEILINAALSTNYILKKPKPFVLQTGLDDFYARYQINCYTKEIDKVPRIYTQLYENIQNGFREAGMDPTTPHFEVNTVRKEKTSK